MTEIDFDQGLLMSAAAAVEVADDSVLDPPRPLDAPYLLDLHRSALEDLGAKADRQGLRRVRVLAWRDLDDPEAGGSELHAHHIAALWAQIGLDVTVRTSAVAGAPAVVRRSGYRAVRKSGRYMVFPRSALSGMLSERRDSDALVEIWNGMPFFSPVWAPAPRLVFLHHVHAEMWRMVLPSALARLGEVLERSVAPPLYRRTSVVTLSDSSRREIVDVLRLPASRVSVVPPGVDRRFTPGLGRSPVPMALAVGRLVPVKRFPELVRVLAEVRRRMPQLRAVLVGDGYGRHDVEAAIRAVGGETWIDLPGYRSDDELVSLYRQAWVLASSSQREGWGMTITEAAACGTPAVVSRIAGHSDAVTHGTSGLLADGHRSMADALVAVLSDDLLRERLRRGALARASALTWEATAAGTLDALLAEHARASARPRRQPRGAQPLPR